MEEKARRITKQYLQALSFDALVVLADECGVDVPKDLGRSFLIADLLDVASEDEDESMIALPVCGERGCTPNAHQFASDSQDALNNTDKNQSGESIASVPPGEKKEADKTELEADKCAKEQNNQIECKSEEDTVSSSSCSPTDVALVASGPLWALVYWNVGGRDALGEPKVFLRIHSFDDVLDVASGDKTVIDIKSLESEHFILMPRKHKYVQIDLLALDEERDAMTSCPIASSAVLELPVPSELLLSNAVSPTPIQKLSGIEPLIKSHYNTYRYSLLGNALQFSLSSAPSKDGTDAKATGKSSDAKECYQGACAADLHHGENL